MEFSKAETSSIEELVSECAAKDSQLLNDLHLTLMGAGNAAVVFS